MRNRWKMAVLAMLVRICPIGPAGRVPPSTRKVSPPELREGQSPSTGVGPDECRRFWTEMIPLARKRIPVHLENDTWETTPCPETPVNHPLEPDTFFSVPNPLYWLTGRLRNVSARFWCANRVICAPKSRKDSPWGNRVRRDGRA